MNQPFVISHIDWLLDWFVIYCFIWLSQ